ncbi:hypothetical protein GCM10027596_39940 [Nocardioides korecus]
MRVPAGVLKAVTHLIAVVASLLLVLVPTAVLPPGLGSVVLLGMIVAVALVTGGKLEGPAVRLTARASAPTDGELQVLTPIPDLAGTHVLVCRNAAHTAAPVVIMGPFTVVSAALVEALYSGRVSTQEVTALVVHARAHHQVIAIRRAEVAIALLETPWRIAVRLFHGVESALAWMPLGFPAWRIRGVAGVVCLVQSVAGGRTWPGVLGAGVIALTYLVPGASQALAARATTAGDAEVVAAGLGRSLLKVLGRSGQQLSLERRQRLQASPRPESSTVARLAPAGPTRHLQVVRR